MVANGDDELLARTLARDPHAIDKIERGARKALRPLDLRERKFIDGMLAHGNVKQATTEAGFSTPGYGYLLLRQPRIKKALYGQAAMTQLRAGVNLSKERLVSELDWAIRQSKQATRRVTVVTKRCECGRDVNVEVRTNPREIANLAIAVTRSVEVAAKIGGHIARADRTPQVVATSYAELVEMLRENPKSFSPSQRADLRAAAEEDRGRIAELVVLLAEPTH